MLEELEEVAYPLNRRIGALGKQQSFAIRCIIRTSVVMQYMTSLYDITHCMLAYSDVITCMCHVF